MYVHISICMHKIGLSLGSLGHAIFLVFEMPHKRALIQMGTCAAAVAFHFPFILFLFFFFFVFFEASVNFAPISAAAAVDVDMYVAMWMRGCPHHRSHTDANTHTSANTCCW